MSEEEKKAIEIKDSIEILKNTELDINTIDGVDLRTYNYAIKVVLNLIEKLQKENEELKADNYELNNRITDLLENIPIRKVKDRIEKYKELSDKFYVKFLESDRYNTDIREKGIKCDAIILALEELIEEREEKE